MLATGLGAGLPVPASGVPAGVSGVVGVVELQPWAKRVAAVVAPAVIKNLRLETDIFNAPKLMALLIV